MNLLPTAIELLADHDDPRRTAAPPARGPRTAHRARSPQLSLALPLGRRIEGRTPSPTAVRKDSGTDAATLPPPAFDAVAATSELWAKFLPTGTITRLDAPEHGWPDALVHAGDAVIVAHGGEVTEGALAAVRLRATDAIQLRRVHRSGHHHLRLQPEDRSVPPLIVPAIDVELIGPVVTIVRRAITETAARRRTA